MLTSVGPSPPVARQSFAQTPFGALPQDLIIQLIVPRLGCYDALSLASSCRRLRLIVDRNPVWLALLRRTHAHVIGWGLKLDHCKELLRQELQIFPNIRRNRALVYELEVHQPRRNPTADETCTGDFTGPFAIGDGVVYAAHHGEGIRAWDLSSVRSTLWCMEELPIQQLKLEGNKLFVQYRDRIKIWDVAKRALEFEISYEKECKENPNIKIRNFWVIGQRLYADLNDGMLREWNLAAKVCDHIFKDAHINFATLHHHENRLHFSSAQGVIKTYNAATRKEESRCKLRLNKSAWIHFIGANILSITKNGEFCVWNHRGEKLQEQVMIRTSRNCGRRLSIAHTEVQGNLMLVRLNGKVSADVFYLPTWHAVGTLPCYRPKLEVPTKGPLYHLGVVYALTSNRTLAVWDFTVKTTKAS